MNEQIDRLKQHLIAIDATVEQFAARIPEAVRSSLRKDAQGALAIIVTAEANYNRTLDRRELIPGTGGTEAFDLNGYGHPVPVSPPQSPEVGAVEFDKIEWIETGTPRVFKYTGTDGMEHFHFRRLDGTMDWMSTGSEEIAAQARDSYDAEQAQKALDLKSDPVQDAGNIGSEGQQDGQKQGQEKAVEPPQQGQEGQPTASVETPAETAQIADNPPAKTGKKK